MAKKLENMTTEERIAHWEKERNKQRLERTKIFESLPLDMKNTILDLLNAVDPVIETALYEGGVRYLSAFDLQHLRDEAETSRRILGLEKHHG
jgi:hypothetical protein